MFLECVMKCRYLFLLRFAIAVLVSLSIAACERAGNGHFTPRLNGIQEKGSIDALGGDFTVSDNFSSNLPLVVIAFNGEGVMEPAVLSVISGSGENRLIDRPEQSAQILLTLDGKKTSPDGKGTYIVNILPQGGQPAQVSLLGMQEADSWVLRGSVEDKSMIRGALAYSLAGRIMPETTPGVRYVEVFFENGNKYYYQGLYLLTEDPVEVLISRSHRDYVLRYPALHGADAGRVISDRRFEIVYPEGSYVGALAPVIEKDINELESVLNAEDASMFFKYNDLLDVDSFIDTFILNEFLLNFSDSPIPVYISKRGGKLWMSPVWDFDYSIDNSPEPVADTHANAENTIWFSKLILSAQFLKSLETRYYALERDELKPVHVNNLVINTYRRLEGALWRDWARWEHSYTRDNRYLLQGRLAGDNETLLIRYTATPEEEVIKIKHNLRVHAMDLKWKLRELQWRDGIYDRIVKVRLDTSIALIFTAVFFLSVFYARNKMRAD